MNFNARPGLFDEDAPDPFQSGDPMGSYFSLSDSLGTDQPNRRDDSVKVETILGNTGYMDLSQTDGPLGYWGDQQDKAVRKWQGDNGLEVDGVLNPGGPTISSMKKATGSLLGGFTAPTADEVDQHHLRSVRTDENDTVAALYAGKGPVGSESHGFQFLISLNGNRRRAVSFEKGNAAVKATHSCSPSPGIEANGGCQAILISRQCRD